MLLHLIILVLIIAFVLIVYLRHRAHKLRNSGIQPCIMLGSGGHTTEMCQLFRNFRFDQCKKIYIIIGATDQLSQSFFSNYFNPLQSANKQKFHTFNFLKVKRTNEVNQSKLTSVFTTLMAFIHAFFLIIKKLLGVTHLISNGPGICVPYFYTFWALNKLGITKTKLIFIESWCRVTSLAATGKLISIITDQYLVHWQDQAKISQKTKYLGQII